MASSAAFTAIKWAGAAYLCFIGVTMLLSRAQAPVENKPAESGSIAPGAQPTPAAIGSKPLRSTHPTNTPSRRWPAPHAVMSS